MREISVSSFPYKMYQLQSIGLDAACEINRTDFRWNVRFTRIEICIQTDGSVSIFHFVN